jgi:cyclophilin family peptidyl-prolyl cis-trans isomerase
MKSRSNHLIISLATVLLLASPLSQAQEGAKTEEAATATSDHPTAVRKTSMGDITLELFADKAPVTVENFIAYAEAGFYDGTVFHRVISHFMIQGGGMTPDLAAKPTSEPIVNESNHGISNTRGTVAMARTSMPDSATSQFFINVQDNANLDYSPLSAGYTVFAKVTEGMEVVDEIRFVETTSSPPYHDVPVEPVIIESVEITTAE